MSTATVFAVWHELPELLGLLRPRFPEVAFDGVPAADRFPPQALDADVLLSFRLREEWLARLPRLRWVQSTGAGVDRLVHLAGLPAEVVLTRTHGDFGRQIAEYSLGALLHHAGAWARLAGQQAGREWARVPRTLLAGRRAGVLGLGVIGGEVAGLLRAAGLKVWGLSAGGRAHPSCDRVFAPAALGEFLAGLDFVVLCLPLTAATRGLLGGPELARLKPGAVLVNVARADVVEERALRAALEAGRVAAAYLDVMWQEPLPADSPWWSLANAFVTPHLAGVTHTEALADEFGENLRRHLSGAPLHGVVDRARGY